MTGCKIIFVLGTQNGHGSGHHKVTGQVGLFGERSLSDGSIRGLRPHDEDLGDDRNEPALRELATDTIVTNRDPMISPRLHSVPNLAETLPTQLYVITSTCDIPTPRW